MKHSNISYQITFILVQCLSGAFVLQRIKHSHLLGEGDSKYLNKKSQTRILLKL
jgi:hypothetical protein